MKLFKSVFSIAFILVFSACATNHSTGDASNYSASSSHIPSNSHNYRYNDLIIKDYDEMNRQVQARIKKARKSATAAAKDAKEGDETVADRAAIEELRDALKLIFSRPNSDNMVAKLAPDVRRELADMSAYEDTISSLAAEEIGIAKDKNANTIQRSTALFVLENLLSEIRPEAATNTELRRVVKNIADADLDIEHDVINDRKLRSMFTTVNPSDMARDILKKLPKDGAKK